MKIDLDLIVQGIAKAQTIDEMAEVLIGNEEYQLLKESINEVWEKRRNEIKDSIEVSGFISHTSMKRAAMRIDEGKETLKVKRMIRGCVENGFITADCGLSIITGLK